MMYSEDGGYEDRLLWSTSVALLIPQCTLSSDIKIQEARCRLLSMMHTPLLYPRNPSHAESLLKRNL